MDFKVEYSAEAVMQLERLEKTIAKRIIKKIERSQTDPHKFFKMLSGRTEYKLRVGNYRVIADIDDKKQHILIRSAGHRRNIYERR